VLGEWMPEVAVIAFRQGPRAGIHGSPGQRGRGWASGAGPSH
jgi:hypothetical protein